MKRFFALAVMAMLVVFAGCANGGNEQASKVTEQSSGLRVVSLKGPTSMGIVKLMEDNKNNTYEIYGTADEAVAKITKGETDIALVPANVASVLYNKTGGKVQVAGINTLGVLYVVENGNTINSVADLKGKTIISTGKGTTPEYALNYVLAKNGIDPSKDVTIEFKSEAAEASAAMAANRGSVAVLPQPYVSTVLAKNQDMRMALDLTAEWDKVSEDSSMVTGVVLVRKEAVDTKKAELDKFLAEYKTSVDFVNNNVEEGARLVAGVGIANEEVAKAAIPYCNIVLIEGDEMKAKLGGYLKALFDQNAASVGGTLPDEAFYYSK